MADGGSESGVIVGSLLYHEVQESRLCAVHCVNAVLQGPYFSEVDLASMAQDLDQQEQQVMLESGAGSSHYLKFMAEGSSNVAADGNFSIQVLNRALEIWNLQCISLEAPEAEEARLDPQKQKAFICHLQHPEWTVGNDQTTHELHYMSKVEYVIYYLKVVSKAVYQTHCPLVRALADLLVIMDSKILQELITIVDPAMMWLLRHLTVLCGEPKDFLVLVEGSEHPLCIGQWAHWFCIRKVGNKWYNFNSLYPAPEFLSNFYLSAYLDTLKSSGWSIFVVQGSLPSPSHWNSDEGFGRWLTPEEAEHITRAAKKAEVEKAKVPTPSKTENEKLIIGSSNLAAALAASFSPPASSVSFANNIGDNEDLEYASAIAASLANIKCPQTPATAHGLGQPQLQQEQQQQDRQGQEQQWQPQQDKQPVSLPQEQQGPDAAALAQALAQSFFAAASASGLNLPASKQPPKD